ncbi:MAG: dTDP-4-amino-4,6-dideoxygalactose transaminase [Flavobacteriales bacterium]|nr:dTDP-4-amino-4,6-dideoxygalactose transaminase [Flavobacteriales bacterium]
MIRFNKPYFTGKELNYIDDAIKQGRLSGNGEYTKRCQDFFEKQYGFKKTLLTTSCTDALEMAALLLNIEQGDEVIMPSYTFVSTANAFALRGAKIVFADSKANHPNIDEDKLEALITSKTKAIVIAHYAGVACNMDAIVSIVKNHNIKLVEDAAQAIDSFYKGQPLGSFGDLATFSFHETKNISSGEGGLLVVNDNNLINRAEIIWEKGTNRAAFFRGEIDKYGWVDIGSSFLPSELIAAFLYAQLENLTDIQTQRKHIWNLYFEGLSNLEKAGKIKLPLISKDSTNNAHMFYILCSSLEERSKLIEHLKTNGVSAVFHYLSLYKSPYFANSYKGKELINSDYYSNTLLRLPLFFELTDKEIALITKLITSFYA